MLSWFDSIYCQWRYKLWRAKVTNCEPILHESKKFDNLQRDSFTQLIHTNTNSSAYQIYRNVHVQLAIIKRHWKWKWPLGFSSQHNDNVWPGYAKCHSIFNPHTPPAPPMVNPQHRDSGFFHQSCYPNLTNSLQITMIASSTEGTWIVIGRALVVDVSSIPVHTT